MLAENLENLVKRERLEGRQEGQHEAREETARNLIARTEMNVSARKSTHLTRR